VVGCAAGGVQRYRCYTNRGGSYNYKLGGFSNQRILCNLERFISSLNLARCYDTFKIRRKGPLSEAHLTIEGNIERFFNFLQEFNFLITLQASSELLLLYKELKEKGKRHKLTTREASRLRNTVLDIYRTLEAEANVRQAFVVTDKRINTEKLFFSVGMLMSPGVFICLPEVAKYDFEECGRCIVFERPTAAAFHILRGTEAVLKMFYLAIVKRNRLAKPMWFDMVVALKKRRSPPPSELLDNLDHIRKSFRNPTQHPEKIYDIEEVQDLFSLCIDAINRMISYLKTKGYIKIDEVSVGNVA